jgi:hypothetical protein
MSTIRAKCLCEGIEYVIEGKLGPIYNCHCSKCRRWHGSAFRTRASIETSQFKIVKGSELLSSFKSSQNVTKHFCRECGSPIHSTYLDSPEVIGIPLGALEGVESSPEAHIFVESKASWYEIADDLPQYLNWPGSESEVRNTSA